LEDGRISYWLMITSRGYWSHLCEKHEWAFSDRSLRFAEKMRPGDRGIVYLLKKDRREPSALGGTLVVTGTVVRRVGDSIFDRMFPVRLPIEVVCVLKAPLPFGLMVPSIDFIKRKDHWGSYLQGHDAIELGVSDYRVMSRAIEKAAKERIPVSHSV